MPRHLARLRSMKISMRTVISPLISARQWGKRHCWTWGPWVNRILLRMRLCTPTATVSISQNVKRGRVKRSTEWYHLLYDDITHELFFSHIPFTLYWYCSSHISLSPYRSYCLHLSLSCLHIYSSFSSTSPSQSQNDPLKFLYFAQISLLQVKRWKSY